MMANNFQRVGSISNAHVGRDFEGAARLFFAETGIALQPNFVVPVGFKIKKAHKFDLGSEDPPILVECKSYTATLFPDAAMPPLSPEEFASCGGCSRTGESGRSRGRPNPAEG
jgi:hypothetical protein